MKATFDEKIKKLKSKLNLWYTRDIGRARIINYIGLTQFFHLASLIEFTEEKIKTIEQLVTNFIWPGTKT